MYGAKHDYCDVCKKFAAKYEAFYKETYGSANALQPPRH